MAYHLPMLSIPPKKTIEIDWITPIKRVIAESYGESPDNYDDACQSLQRCRQEAVQTFGVDIPALYRLYKYFGQLELLELRFPGLDISFPWHDAWTNKLFTQTSLTYEKASVLFQMAATNSVLGTSQNRVDPEESTCAFVYFRTCAGILIYLKNNFLHNPSPDLSNAVLKFLADLFLAQATETFLEKRIEEKEDSIVVAKIGAQATSMYTMLSEDIVNISGKGIFDQNWAIVLRIKAHHFHSVSQFFQGIADNKADKHAEALMRFRQAETCASNAYREGSNFAAAFATNESRSMSKDIVFSLQKQTKSQLDMLIKLKTEVKFNKFRILGIVFPPLSTTSVIEKVVVATPIPIHDIFGTLDVQKVIGSDFFARLLPPNVRQSVGAYSERKAQLLRKEMEKAEAVERKICSTVDSLLIGRGLVRYKAMTEGKVAGEEVPMGIRQWKEDIALVEDRNGVEALIHTLTSMRSNVQHDLGGISRDLVQELQEWETMRAIYGYLWTQAPSATMTTALTEVRSYFTFLETARASDGQVVSLWKSARDDIELLLSFQIDQLFIEERAPKSLDTDSDNDSQSQEWKKIQEIIEKTEYQLKNLKTLFSNAKNQILEDLKDKIATDDMSSLLLANQQNPGRNEALFASELQKYRPYQQCLASTVNDQELMLQTLTTHWRRLKDLESRNPGAQKWDAWKQKQTDIVARFSRARDAYMDVRDGLTKGFHFYTELTDLISTLGENVRSILAVRRSERESLLAKFETEKSPSAASLPLSSAERSSLQISASHSISALDDSISSINLGDHANSLATRNAGEPQNRAEYFPNGRGTEQHQKTKKHGPGYLRLDLEGSIMHQSPMITIPKKMTKPVDWTTPIRHLIVKSYGKDPDNYAVECAALQRCREDAVFGGAGSDKTARDLLLKYFGQLERLQLRFPDIRTDFPWRDAFTNKLVTQTTVTYEKSCVLFLLAATYSVIAGSTNRSTPEGLKHALEDFRSCIGLLVYQTENFLYAPTTDLSREVVEFVMNVILAQAMEVSFETSIHDKESMDCLAKVASQTTSMYKSLVEEAVDFKGKGRVDLSWINILQVKAKYFNSVAQYCRAMDDYGAGYHDEALVRFNQAALLAKDARDLAVYFASKFFANKSPTLPRDAGTSIQERTQAHLIICATKRKEVADANETSCSPHTLPTFDTLPLIQRAAAVTPISIADIFGAPDIQKTIGQDIFECLSSPNINGSPTAQNARLGANEILPSPLISDDENHDVLPTYRDNDQTAGDECGQLTSPLRWPATVNGPEDQLPTAVKMEQGPVECYDNGVGYEESILSQETVGDGWSHRDLQEDTVYVKPRDSESHYSFQKKMDARRRKISGSTTSVDSREYGLDPDAFSIGESLVD